MGVLYLICWRRNYPQDRGTRPPIVQLLDNAYKNGVRVAKKAFHKIEERLERHASLPKYCVRIQPRGG